MQKTIIIDVEKIIFKLRQDYDGNKSIKQWLNKTTQKHIINLIDVQLKALNLFQSNAMTYEFNKDERIIKLTITWLEDININTFNAQVKEDTNNILNYLWSKDITAYT